jgi:preprotein translocase subunit SecY
MAETTDRELLITIVKDLTEVKTEMRGYRQLEKDVRDLQKKIYQMTGVSGVLGGVIVAVAQILVSVSK